MKIIHIISRTPPPIANLIDISVNKVLLQISRKIKCDVSQLGLVTEKLLSAVENCDADAGEWLATIRDFEKCGLDRAAFEKSTEKRLLFNFVRQWKPKTVLEIGTFLGHSALVFSSALTKAHKDSGNCRICSVDVVDVNDESEGYWAKLGQRRSPQELSYAVEADAVIEFVQSDSVRFLNECRERFDMIFIDGHHRATTVYQEITLSLSRLNSGGILLLHDYYPFTAVPRNRKIIPGPYMAVQRLCNEGVTFDALPLCTVCETRRIPTSLCVIASRSDSRRTDYPSVADIE